MRTMLAPRASLTPGDAEVIRYAKVGAYHIAWMPEAIAPRDESGRQRYLLADGGRPDRTSGAFTFNSREWAVLVGRAAIMGWRLVEAFGPPTVGGGSR